MKKIKKRFKKIDYLKGIAAIAVILGHSIQRGMIIDFDKNWLFKYIYTFHMPLFILLAGYVLYFNDKIYNNDFILNKFKRLIIPTIVWSYLIWLVRDLWFVGIKPFIKFPNSIIEYSKMLFLHPNSIIWFLYVLFFYNLILFFGKKLPRKMFFSYIIMIFVFLFLAPKNYFGLYQIYQYYIFFFIGYYVAQNKEIYKKYQNYFLILSIIYFIIYFSNYSLIEVGTLKYYLLTLSSVFIVYSFTLIKVPVKIHNICIWIGQNSMEIYLIQCLFLNIGIGVGTLKITTIFINASIISFLLTYTINQIPLIKKILFCK